MSVLDTDWQALHPRRDVPGGLAGTEAGSERHRGRTATVAGFQAPTDGFKAPTDSQQVITGGVYQQTPPAPARGPSKPGGTGPSGPAGFRLD